MNPDPARHARRGRTVRYLIVTAAVALAAAVGVTVVALHSGGAAAGNRRPAAQTSVAGSPATAIQPSAAAVSAGPSTASAAASVPPSARPGSARPGGYPLPSANAKFDYQIGQAYSPPSGVTVLSRDRGASPAAGRYTICYVNAFQVQPDELSWWKANHDDLLLKKNGSYVVDTGWDENLIDISTAAKRTAVATIVNGWVDGCAAKGFQAVEPDNIDSYQRSDGLLTQAEAVAYLALLAPHAHAKGLAIAQKNTTELGTRGRGVGLDFAIAEECGRYGECGDYTAVYGNLVFDIEYTASAFTKACGAYGATLSIVRRDVDVTAPGSGSYVYDAC